MSETEGVTYSYRGAEVLLVGQGFEFSAFFVGVNILVVAVVPKQVEVEGVLWIHLPLHSQATPVAIDVGVGVADEGIV